MESLHMLKDMLKEKDYMCKIEMKDPYFCLPLHRKYWEYIRFCWEGQLYKFLCLFRLGTSSMNFYKASENPNSDSTRNQHSNDGQPERYTLDEQKNIRPEHSKGFSLTAIAVHNKSEKTSTVGNPETRILGSGNRLRRC